MMHCRGICARPEEQLCVSPRRWRWPSASSCGRGEPRKGPGAGLHAVQVACAAGGRRAAAAARRLQPGRQARRFGLLCRPPAQARAQRCNALKASTHRLRSCSQVSSACVACAWPPARLMDAGWAYSIWWLEQHQRKTSTFCFGVGTFEACRTCDLQNRVGRAFRAFSGPCQDTTAGLGALLISLRHCCAESFGSAFTLMQAAIPRFDVCVYSAVAISQANNRLGLQTSFYLYCDACKPTASDFPQLSEYLSGQRPELLSCRGIT